MATKPKVYAHIPDELFADVRRFKYPMDTKERAQSALRYFGMPRNAQEYSPEERKVIHARMILLAKAQGVHASASDGASYKDLLEQAKHSEEEAIALYHEVLLSAPKEDSAKLIEILNDERQHFKIVEGMLS